MAMESSEFSELDRISTLPDEIIARVPSFLPTMKHAFMTSILSRRWQYLYCLTDELDIEVTSNCIQEFVDRVLMLRGGAHLRKLCLKHHCSHYGIHGSPIESWIKTALLLGLQELDLSVDFYDFSLLDSIWSHKQLTALKLCVHGSESLGFVYDKDIVVSLPRLRSLHLENIYFEPYLVNRIFADSLLLESARIVECSWRKGDALCLCSKALESLVMKRCYGSNFERIKAIIDAPSLLEFKFGGRSYMVDYTFKNFDSLDVVTLALVDYVEEDFGSQMDFLLNLISAVAKTRHLHLSGFCMPGFRWLYWHLQKQSLSAPFSSSIETIEVCDFFGRDRDFEMIEFIIQNVKALKELIVHVDINVSTDIKPQIRRKLLMLEKNSTQCSIEIEWY